jgi:hypothetical protein
MTAKPAVTVDQFKTWCRDCVPAARAVLMARVHADMERTRVDAYIRPIFDSYTFPVNPEWAERYGETVKTPKDLYLSDPAVEDLVTNYFEDCDAAHRAHGFTGPKGHCPALIAEHLVIQAEHQFMLLAQPLFGLDPVDLYGDNRKKYLELLIGACLKAEKEGKAA